MFINSILSGIYIEAQNRGGKCPLDVSSWAKMISDSPYLSVEDIECNEEAQCMYTCGENARCVRQGSIVQLTGKTIKDPYECVCKPGYVKTMRKSCTKLFSE